MKVVESFLLCWTIRAALCPGRNITVVTGQETVRQFPSGELRDLNCISTVVTLTKWKRVGLARHVACDM